MILCFRRSQNKKFFAWRNQERQAGCLKHPPARRLRQGGYKKFEFIPRTLNIGKACENRVVRLGKVLSFSSLRLEFIWLKQLWLLLPDSVDSCWSKRVRPRWQTSGFKNQSVLSKIDREHNLKIKFYWHVGWLILFLSTTITPSFHVTQ